MRPAFEVGSICLDEDCDIIEMHAPHVKAATIAAKPIRPHHRPNKIRCEVCAWRGVANLMRLTCPDCGGRTSAVVEARPWQVHDARAIVNAIAKATSKIRPVTFSMIFCSVIDSYGSVSERTVHRHLTSLVDRRCLIKYREDLAYAVYLRAGSTLTHDEIVDMYDMIDTIDTPDQVKRKQKPREVFS